MKTFTDHEIEYTFERRRYGTGASIAFFTWMLWRKVGSKEWKSYGDPWKKSRLSRLDIVNALARIRFDFLILPGNDVTEPGPWGSQIRLHNGCVARVLDKFEDGRLTVRVHYDDVPRDFTINVLEHPTNVVEVL